MAFQQNPIPQSQASQYGGPLVPGSGANPVNPGAEHLGPVGVSQPLHGVNGFSGASEGVAANNFQPILGPPSTGPNAMNGPTNFLSNQKFRPGMPPRPGQTRMPMQPSQFSGQRPPVSSSAPPVSSAGYRIPGQLSGMGPQRPPIVSQGPTGLPNQRPPVPSELPVPFHGQGQYTHQVGMALTPGITPANSGPPSERTSRDNSPALSNATESSQYDALEGQWKPGTGEPSKIMPPVSKMGSSVPNTVVSSVGQTFPPSSQTMATRPTEQPGQRFSAPSTNTGVRPGFPPTFAPDQRPGFPPANQQPGFVPASFQPIYPAPPSSRSASQQPGFPSPSSSANQQPGFPSSPSSSANQQQRFPPPPTSFANQQPGFSPFSSTANQQPGFPPPPSSSASQQQRFPPPPTSFANQQPGFSSFPPSSSANQQPGFPPTSFTNQPPGFPPNPPTSFANQQPGFPPPPSSLANQHQGFPPPPTSSAQRPGFPPPVSSAHAHHPGFPPGPANAAQQPSRLPPPPTNSQFPNRQPPGPQGIDQQKGTSIEEFVNSYPKHNQGAPSLAANFGSMTLQGPTVLNLLQQKQLIPPEGVETPKPVIPNDFKNVNCSPEVFRCTLNAIPQTSALLNKARLPLGILIHPFKDLSQLPVIQSSVIVRCRSCRTYINPFVYFLDSRRWKCNLCYRANELPDEFSFDPVSKTYGDPQRRPEIRSATIEFIAPSEYMLRPPQPAVYLYLLDVSFNAIETGYLRNFCKTLLDVLDKIPGDSRTQIGFIAYDSAVHFFNLAEGLSQPQMLTVTDVEDIFLPCPDDLMVNLNGSRSLVEDLLNQLPTMFDGNMETKSALGAALQAAYKMISGPGGRVTVMQTILPSMGPGALQSREDAVQKTAKDVSNLGPATDFYKKLALDCSAQQVAVDLFMFNAQYADLSSIECISKFSGGVVQFYPAYHAVKTPHLVKKFEVDLRRYLTRKIGFEAVMRIRCSKGMSIHTFHGNFFVRSTDLLSLPNINPDAGFGMQMSIEEPLTDMSTMCFQAALLYTSSKGERRIRVHTLCLPITNQISEIYASADQQAIIALLAKMAVDRSLTSSLSDAREAIVNATVDILNSYGLTLPATQRSGSIPINDQLRLMPLFCLALLKSTGLRVGVSTRLDERVFALQEFKTQPVIQLLLRIHPNLYPVHTIMEVGTVKKGNLEYPQLPVLQLSSANIDRHGAYLLDTGAIIYLYVGSAINAQFCQDILDSPNFASIKEGGIAEFPELENEGSERFQDFIAYLMDVRPDGAAFIVVREDGPLRMQFFQHFIEDRTESSMSYYEYLQHIQKQLKS